ncbi:capsular polysaccharide export protein, LipB/KpsS family [Neisseria weaveri]|uniref:capsular polysaccharide export protein, LipB/KpsS family n=1 Tax=Neisseria weaveri TaxID=28091 RepID=UPI000D307646|nr:capsule biosynthesis protein [Neisseria weaveri]
MNISILVADSLHINKKNFGSFFKFIEKNKVKVHFEQSHKDWISLYGVYDSKLDKLIDKIEILSKLSSGDLQDFKINDINLFSICRAEILTLVSTLPSWYEKPYPKSNIGIFNKLLAENKNILLQNMASAWYWLDFWKVRLTELYPFTHCCVFSGGLTYQKALIEQLKFTPTKVMVMESLFTGNEYYCEERYSSIANNCDIKHSAVYQNYLNNLGTNTEYDRERSKAINKILLSKNKNVEQPDFSETIEFSEKSLPCVSIIGQVINDFSVLEYKNTGISTISFYKELIDKLTKNGFNVVMKTHPWEEKKNNIHTSLTKNILTEFIENLTNEQQNRIKLVDHYSIKQLFNQTDWVVGLNSQGLLEATFEGFKTVQFGNAFYGKKGFTSDYDLNDIETFIRHIKNHEINNILSMHELDLFEKFITILLQKHTVSIHDSGVAILQKIFTLPNFISLVSGKQSQRIQDTNAPSTLLPNNTIKNSKNIDNSQPEKELIIKNNNFIEQSSKINKNIKINRKINKFKNNPRQFFADSPNQFLRLFHHFFKSKI